MAWVSDEKIKISIHEQGLSLCLANEPDTLSRRTSNAHRSFVRLYLQPELGKAKGKIKGNIQIPLMLLMALSLTN